MTSLLGGIYFRLYGLFLYPLAKSLLPLIAKKNQKVAAGLKLRENKPWLSFQPKTNPVWIHCASFEFEYAKPVIQELKRRHPHKKILVTYFSPTVQKAAEGFPGVDFATPSPWDDRETLNQFLIHHEPCALLIARTDTWPEMVFQTHRRKIPSLLFSTTIARSSGRLGLFMRSFTQHTLSQMTEIFCVADDDKKTLESIGISAKVAGDTRFDQVLARLKNPKAFKSELFFDSETATIVYGSTWEEDERVLVEVICETKNVFRHVIVPHEPTPAHLEQLRTTLENLGLEYELYSQATAPSQKILLVDQIGILAELYAKARFAFVGGSFRKTVHSVMEPLAAGCLTFVGPHHENNREALEFKTITAPGGFSCVEVVRSPSEWTKKLRSATQSSNLAEFIVGEVKKRSGQSKLVVDWLEKNCL